LKILVLNPNTSEVFTAAIQAGAERYRSIGTDVVATSPSSGPRSIESKYDQLLCAQPSLEVLIAREAEFDGFVIACFSDHPLIYAAREMSSKPVLGIMEAALYTACMLGQRFSIVTTGSNKGSPGVWTVLRRYGLADRCASVRTTGLTVLDLEAASDAKVRLRILEEARRAVDEDTADVICLGCAGMVGLDKEIQNELGVPVIDGVAAAVKLVEALVGYGVGTSKRGAYAWPHGKSLLNMNSLFEKPYASN
jgi:allantoin racemase